LKSIDYNKSPNAESFGRNGHFWRAFPPDGYGNRSDVCDADLTLTAQCLVKYKGIVSRADAPKTLWQNIALYGVLGLLGLGLCLCTLN
jgi:hypothetical protein